MRTDRSDGFVGRNFLLRGAAEHGFYTEETDGILLDRVKFFWALDYGHLSFTTDHNVIQNCDGFGAGDAVVYPGAAPQTGEFRDRCVYPTARYNTVVRKCDLRGSTLAYSGSMGNSVRITENHIYGNTNGISSDTLSAPGHPGYPADGMLIDNNLIYSNNLDLYGVEPPPVEPLVPMPIGTGIVWPGMNGGVVRDNHIFDNWRHGAVLASVPDALAGEPEGNVDPAVHCAVTGVSTTSCGNRFFGNVMGRPPPGFKFNSEIGKFGNRHGAVGTGVAAQRRRLLVGRVRRQQRQLLVSRTPARTARRTRSPARARGAARSAAEQLRHERGPGRSGQGGGPGRLLDVLARRHARRPSALLLVPDAPAARHRSGARGAAAHGAASRGVHAKPPRPCDATADR